MKLLPLALMAAVTGCTGCDSEQPSISERLGAALSQQPPSAGNFPPVFGDYVFESDPIVLLCPAGAADTLDAGQYTINIAQQDRFLQMRMIDKAEASDSATWQFGSSEFIPTNLDITGAIRAETLVNIATEAGYVPLHYRYHGLITPEGNLSGDITISAVLYGCSGRGTFKGKRIATDE